MRDYTVKVTFTTSNDSFKGLDGEEQMDSIADQITEAVMESTASGIEGTIRDLNGNSVGHISVIPMPQ